MSKETFDVVYDEQYMGPGYVIYRKDYKKIMKIYEGNYFGFQDYNVMAKDEHSDREDMKFREIIFPVDNSSVLYDSVKRLHDRISNNPIFTSDSCNQGKNSFRVEQTDKGYSLVASKDVYGVKQSSDTVDILLGDNFSCEEWEAVNEFYTNIGQITTEKEISNVALKILSLKPLR